jgi:hypothetical protein
MRGRVVRGIATSPAKQPDTPTVTLSCRLDPTPRISDVASLLPQSRFFPEAASSQSHIAEQSGNPACESACAIKHVPACADNGPGTRHAEHARGERVIARGSEAAPTWSTTGVPSTGRGASNTSRNRGFGSRPRSRATYRDARRRCSCPAVSRAGPFRAQITWHRCPGSWQRRSFRLPCSI